MESASVAVGHADEHPLFTGAPDVGVSSAAQQPALP